MFWFSDRHKSDVERYREGYPGQKDDKSEKLNLQFYTGQVRSTPNGDFVDNIHKNWIGEYDMLEDHHGYIQWLFPIREEGMNYRAQRLQLHEAKAIAANPAARKRVLRSYKLMLDFYGMKLYDLKTGELRRSARWQRRYQNLNTSYHNYLRITRIIKSLGELGWANLQYGFCKHILDEVRCGELWNTFDSACKYWCSVVKDDTKRESLEKHATAISDLLGRNRRRRDFVPDSKAPTVMIDADDCGSDLDADESTAKKKKMAAAMENGETADVAVAAAASAVKNGVTKDGDATMHIDSGSSTPNGSGKKEKNGDSTATAIAVKDKMADVSAPLSSSSSSSSSLSVSASSVSASSVSSSSSSSKEKNTSSNHARNPSDEMRASQRAVERVTAFSDLTSKDKDNAASTTPTVTDAASASASSATSAAPSSNASAPPNNRACC